MRRLAAVSMLRSSVCEASKRNDLVSSHISGYPSSDTQVLMGLGAELPLRMSEAIGDRAPGVLANLGAVHRLQREALELEAGEILRRQVGLRVDQFQFVALAYLPRLTRLGAAAAAVDLRRRLHRAVRLDRDLEALRMQRGDQLGIDLQQRLATGQHHEAMCLGPVPRPR